jgi:hypothetical protein
VDVALLDLFLPMSKITISPSTYEDELVPYGFVLSLRAALVGVKYIAVATDVNHHEDALSAAFDELGIGNGVDDGFNAYWPREDEGEIFKPNCVINDAKALFVHAPKRDGVVKDWERVLEVLLRES